MNNQATKEQRQGWEPAAGACFDFTCWVKAFKEREPSGFRCLSAVVSLLLCCSTPGLRRMLSRHGSGLFDLVARSRLGRRAGRFRKWAEITTDCGLARQAGPRSAECKFCDTAQRGPSGGRV